jgi:hypothetical protein
MQNNYTSHLVRNHAPNPPLASINTLTNPLEEQELALNCHIIKRPPSGIYKQLTDPPGE